MKNVEIPVSMPRAIAQEAEALREQRANQSTGGTEVGAEQNSMTVIVMPSESVSMARAIAEGMTKRP